MKRNPRLEFRVGVFVFVALLIGSGLTFVIGNQSSFFTPKTDYTAVFDSVAGLRAGSSVRIAGVNVGTVSDVEIREDGKILVTVGIVGDARNLIRVDSLATIGNKGMLGDKLVDITVGTAAVLPVETPIPTESPVDMFSYLAKAGDIMDEAEGTARNVRLATNPLGNEQFGQEIQEITHNLATLTRMAADENGSVAQLLRDPETVNRLNATLRQAESATREIALTARSSRMIIDEIRTGDGAAHELIYGTEGSRLVTNLADTAGEIATLLREIRTGDGALHDLVYEQEGQALIANLTQATADIANILERVREGEGTIGGLLMDPSIYEDVKRLVGDLERNDVLRSLVRYSIRHDDTAEPARVQDEELGTGEGRDAPVRVRVPEAQPTGPETAPERTAPSE